MCGARRSFVHAALVPALLASVAMAARAGETSPPVHDRAGILLTGTWTSVRLVDETDSPVRWRGDGPGWRLAVEVPVRATRLRIGLCRDSLPVTVDAQGGPATEPGQYLDDSRFRSRKFIAEEVLLEARRRAAGGNCWHLDAGAFARWRDAFLADAGASDGTGSSGVACGPSLCLTWRTGRRWDLATGLSFPLCGWYIRAPYLGYSRDYDWVRDIRFATLPECGRVDLEAVVRYRLGGRFTVEGGGRGNYSWTDRNRRWRELDVQSRLDLVIGL